MGAHSKVSGTQICVTKNLIKKVNLKEKRIAFASALAATANPDLIIKRGHIIEGLESHVIVIDDKVQTIKKTSGIVFLLEKIGLMKELERARKKKIRAGKGKKRGRKYKRAKGSQLRRPWRGLR